MTYVGFLKSVPRELEEAAAIDGAGPFRTMVQIILPLVKSTTVTIGILFFLWTWNDLLLPSIMISDVNLRTITVNLYMAQPEAERPCWLRPLRRCLMYLSQSLTALPLQRQGMLVMMLKMSF